VCVCVSNPAVQENDEKVQEAIKRAETEAKAKQDKAGIWTPVLR
jgi:hypothetical protein